MKLFLIVLVLGLCTLVLSDEVNSLVVSKRDKRVIKKTLADQSIRSQNLPKNGKHMKNIDKKNGRKSKRKDIIFDFPQPLKPELYIMFWRPQKVGSSTVASMFASFGFRYNLYPRGKSSANGFCRKLARCEIAKLENMTSVELNNEKNQNRLMHLEKFANGNGKGQGSKKRFDKDVDASLFRMSINHELCNLHNNIIENNLKCGFNINENDNKAQIKQVFLVR